MIPDCPRSLQGQYYRLYRRPFHRGSSLRSRFPVHFIDSTQRRAFSLPSVYSSPSPLLFNLPLPERMLLVFSASVAYFESHQSLTDAIAMHRKCSLVACFGILLQSSNQPSSFEDSFHPQFSLSGIAFHFGAVFRHR